MKPQHRVLESLLAIAEDKSIDGRTSLDAAREAVALMRDDLFWVLGDDERVDEYFRRPEMQYDEPAPAEEADGLSWADYVASLDRLLAASAEAANKANDAPPKPAPVVEVRKDSTCHYGGSMFDVSVDGDWVGVFCTCASGVDRLPVSVKQTIEAVIRRVTA